MSSEQIIDVLVVFDTVSILNKYGTNTTPDTPVQVTDNNMIYMVTNDGNAVSGQAGNELNIKAETLDVIRWREASLSLNSDAEAILYKFVATSGGDLISAPAPLQVTVKEPLPNPQDPTSPTMQEVKAYFWNSNVLSPGSVTYHFQFMIVDRDGNTQGYYWWDPFITITD